MKKKFLTILLIFTSTVLVVWALSLTDFRFENRVQDFYISRFAKTSDRADIKLIVIDDESVNRVRYPWPRNMFAEMFDYLQTYGQAKIIVFDAVVSSDDTYNKGADEKFFRELPTFKKLVAGYALQRSEKSPYSDRERFVRDRFFTTKTNIKIRDMRTYVPREKNDAFSSFPFGYLKNIKYLGHVHNFPDTDGILRTSTPAMEYKGELYPSLALQAYSVLTGINNFVVDDHYLCSDDNCTAFKMPISTKREDHAGIYSIVNWYKIKYKDENAGFSHQYIPAIRIIDSYHQIKNGEKPDIDPAQFKDAIIYVGGCANEAIISDKKITPLATNQAGVDYQATVLENMLSQKFIKKMDTTRNLLIIISMCLITLIAIRKSSIRVALTVTAILLTLYYIASVILVNQRVLMLILTPVICEVIVFGAGYAYQFFIEGRTKQKLQRAMGQYISKDIMRAVFKNIDEIGVGGKRAEVSVMFVDIRGFTTISEKLPPEEVTEILNEYISEVEPIIRKYKGVLNKFIGDAIMAIFGEPLQEKNHAENAVRCADEILKRIKILQLKWSLQGKPKIEIGIGICTGEVFIGNIGSHERLEYTVIGDVVNTASRIESFNKIYKTKFLISQETYTRVRDIADVIMIKEVTIRGKSQKINIYEVLRIVECPQH